MIILSTLRVSIYKFMSTNHLRKSPALFVSETHFRTELNGLSKISEKRPLHNRTPKPPRRFTVRVHVRSVDFVPLPSTRKDVRVKRPSNTSCLSRVLIPFFLLFLSDPSSLTRVYWVLRRTETPLSFLKYFCTVLSMNIHVKFRNEWI